MAELNYDEAEQVAVRGVLQTGWLTLGPRTEEFEAAMAQMLGVRHTVAVANCTCALELAYRYCMAGKSKGGAERGVVLVPNITFVATASAAVAAGLHPMLADGRSSRNPVPDVAALGGLCDEMGDRVAAVVVMHYAGYDADVEEVAALCEARGIAIIEDVAHGPGAKSAGGRMLGSIGHTGCFSFFSNKNLATGEGGLLATDDPEVAAWYRQARSHGMTASTWKRHSGMTSGYDVLEPGRNFRCTEMTAALGLAQLDKLQAGNERRRELTLKYRQAFEGAGLAAFPELDEEVGRSAYHLMPLTCRDREQRERIRAGLAARSIQTSHHYPPIHTLSWYADQQDMHGGTLENSVAFADIELTLPLYPTMTDEIVEEVITVVLESAG